MSCSTENISRFEIRVRALKPWTLPVSILPILLGTLLAYKTSNEPFEPFPFILCCCVIIGTHAAGNFVNSYYEAKSRSFYWSSTEREVTVHEIARCAVVTYTVAIPSFAVLLVSAGAYIWQELALFCVGFAASVLFGKYLKNLAVGELAVSAIYGPLCVLFTYAVQVGSRRELTGSTIALYSLPLAILTECLLHSQNIRDLEPDKKKGSKTFATLLGGDYAISILPVMLLGPYITTAVMGYKFSKYFLLPLLSLPLSMLSLPKYQQDIAFLPEKISVAGLIFGLLYLLSFLYAF